MMPWNAWSRAKPGATADSLHSYAWDAEGNSITIDTKGLTFDALGRMVEQQNGSSYTEILYGPTGKLALMNGQSVTKAFIPLPAGATAVYTSGPTLSYFRHPDWLGSSRFASTASRSMYYSGAYAPFGETYAEAGTPDRSFTGQNQDTVQGTTTGLYDFLFREHAQYGRWISPDPAGLAAIDPTDPQTCNRYLYVGNDPLDFFDPAGLAECSLNVSLSFPSFATSQFKTGVQTQLSSLFGPEISLNFVNSGADVNLSFSSVIGYSSGGEQFGAVPTNIWNPKIPLNQGIVDVGQLLGYQYLLGGSQGQTKRLAAAAGRVAAHELGHELYLLDNPLGGLMGDPAKTGSNPFQNLSFSYSEKLNLFNQCQQLRKTLGGSGSSAPYLGPGVLVFTSYYCNSEYCDFYSYPIFLPAGGGGIFGPQPRPFLY